MLKKIIYAFKVVLVLFSVGGGKVFSQDQINLDQLKKELYTATADTQRCQILNLLAENAPDGEWEKYNGELFKLLYEKIKGGGALPELKVYTKCAASCINNKAITVDDLGNRSLAAKMYFISYKLYKAIENYSGMADALNNIGVIESVKGNKAKALDYYNASLFYSKKANDIRGVASSLHNIAGIEKETGSLVKTIEFYENSLKLCVENNFKDIEALNLIQLSSVYFSQNENEAALKYSTQAYSLLLSVGDETKAAECANIIASYYILENDLVAAKKYTLAALNINEKYQIPNGIAMSYVNLEKIYEKGGQLDSALAMCEKANAYANESANESTIITIKLRAAELYFKKNELDKAMSFANEAYSHSKSSFENEPHLMEILSAIYAKLGNYQKAFLFQSELIELNNRLLNSKTKENAIKSHFKIEFEKKALTDSITALKAKQTLEARITSQKNNTYILVLLLTVAILIAAVIFQRVRIHQKLRMLNMRNQIASDLHDEVGSSLSSIKMIAAVAKNNPEKISQQHILETIEETSRETLENISDIVWSLKPKNDSFQLMLEKMKGFAGEVSSANGITLSFVSNGNLEAIVLTVDQRKNLYLIFKEVINNAAKYASCKHLRVSISKDSKNLILEISDDGVGFNSSVSGKGNGLVNMQSRAHEMGAILKIDSKPGSGTRITLKLKLPN